MKPDAGTRSRITRTSRLMLAFRRRIDGSVRKTRSCRQPMTSTQPGWRAAPPQTQPLLGSPVSPPIISCLHLSFHLTRKTSQKICRSEFSAFSSNTSSTVSASTPIWKAQSSKCGQGCRSSRSKRRQSSHRLERMKKSSPKRVRWASKQKCSPQSWKRLSSAPKP